MTFKRPILIITICYITSILWGIYLKKYILLFCVILAIINIYYYLKIKNKSNFLFINICIIIIFFSTIIIKNKDNSFYKFNPENENYSGIVLIENEESDSEYYNNYIGRLMDSNGKKTNKKLLIKINKKSNKKYKCGDVISIYGEFQKGEIRRNYKGFSYFEYLKTKNIYGIVRCDKSKKIKTDSTNVYKMWIDACRKRFCQNIKRLLPEKNDGIAMALLMGDSTQIADDQKELFSNASLSHILAISGMHVSYVIMGFGFLLKKFGKRTSKILFIFLLIIFANITGASPSVVRAVIMSVLAICASLIYRKSDTINNISISCLIILIFNPYSLFNLGFQLSFFGTLGIVLFHSRIDFKMKSYCNTNMTLNKISDTAFKLLEKITEILSVSISANIMIFPVLIYNFNNISFIFLLSNILVTPILGFLIFSGYIVVLLSIVSIKIAILPAKLFNFVIIVFYKIAEICSNIKFLKFVVGTPKIYIVIFMYLGIFIVFFYSELREKLWLRKINFKKIISLILIISILFRILNIQNKKFKIYMVDVGQGDCTLIVTNTNKTILIDGGGSESGDYDVGKKVLVPYLLDRQITSVDYILFSHFDSDHCLGLFSVMEELKVKNAIVSEQSKESSNYKKFCKLAKDRKVKVIKVKAGDKLKIDKFTSFEILWPLKNQLANNPLNNNSIVCKMCYKNISVLFTGDVEEEAERELVKIYGNGLKSDVLKVAHHGSKTSSSNEFVNCVRPKIALIGVGKNNKFGHPNEEIMEKLKSMRCNYL